MKVLLYKGRSVISRAIRFQTRSQYSHAAVMLDDGSVIEAWHKGGVRKVKSPFDGHSDRTEIDVYGIVGDYDVDVVQTFLEDQVGKEYDFSSVFRFLSRRKASANGKWFCSELVLEAFSRNGLDLLHGRPSELSPRDVALSPYLMYEDRIK